MGMAIRSWGWFTCVRWGDSRSHHVIYVHIGASIQTINVAIQLQARYDQSIQPHWTNTTSLPECVSPNNNCHSATSDLCRAIIEYSVAAPGEYTGGVASCLASRDLHRPNREFDTALEPPPYEEQLQVTSILFAPTLVDLGYGWWTTLEGIFSSFRSYSIFLEARKEYISWVT